MSEAVRCPKCDYVEMKSDRKTCPLCGTTFETFKGTNKEYEKKAMISIVRALQSMGHEVMTSEGPVPLFNDDGSPNVERIRKIILGFSGSDDFADPSGFMVRNPEGKSFPFVYQWHVRGIPPDWSTEKIKAVLNRSQSTTEPLSIHGDIRFERPQGNLIGWTLFTPGNFKQRDKISNNRTTDRVRSIPKNPHPKEWLRVQGRLKSGYPKGDPHELKADSYFLIRSTGRMTYGTCKDGFYEYFLKFNNPQLSKLSGRWIWTRIRRDADGDVWNVSKPKEQRPYIDTHNEADKEPGEIWQYVPAPGLDIPRSN